MSCVTAGCRGCHCGTFASFFFPLSDFLLCYELMFFEAWMLISGEKMSSTLVEESHEDWKLKVYHITLCLQVKVDCEGGL